MNRPQIIDLFAGVGGMSLGFRHAGFGTVVANEIDPSIAASYGMNHPKTNVITEDITNLDLGAVFGEFNGRVDGVVGGPPCQGFSQKGHRKTINDPRNYLFRSFFEVVKVVEPKFFVMENVPNLLTNENGLFAAEIRELFETAGYHVTMRVLSAAELGIPQFRRRAVIVGSKKSQIDLTPPRVSKTVTVWDAISDLNFLGSGEGVFEQSYRESPQSKYQSELRAGSKALFNHVATRHSPLALERMALVPEGGDRTSLPAHHLTRSIYSGTWARMERELPSVTITTRFDTPSSGRFTHPLLDRAITVREAARLQSFPDSFVFHGNKTSQMKQVGNAVPPLLAKHVASVVRTSLF
ncbi:DNA cytosine methyltransferase [Arthrobacter jinronghuae]|uniref:DNA cytosine methyltransferase n=1 Tax=Arthrobacter jinronghuae TaxID=2964609 RepID=UPI00210583AF|nr:DNA cytosine methyltransferase [Arthrobacter jinronghuae]